MPKRPAFNSLTERFKWDVENDPLLELDDERFLQFLSRHDVVRASLHHKGGESSQSLEVIVLIPQKETQTWLECSEVEVQLHEKLP